MRPSSIPVWVLPGLVVAQSQAETHVREFLPSKASNACEDFSGGYHWAGALPNSLGDYQSSNIAVSMLQVALNMKHTHSTKLESAAVSKKPLYGETDGGSYPSMQVVAIELLLLGLFLYSRTRIWGGGATALRHSCRGSPRCSPPHTPRHMGQRPIEKGCHLEATMPSLAMTDGREPRLLHHRISMQAEARPDRLALIDGNNRENFLELHLSVLYVARHLVEERGVKPSSRTAIGVCAEGRCLMHALLGILHTGNPYVPLPSIIPAAQLEFIMSDAKIEVVLADFAALSAGGPWEGRTETSPASVLTASLTSPEAWKPSWEVQEDDLAYILYTSGSTGQPKGVMSAHTSYHSRMAWMHQFYPLSEDEVGIQKTAINWVDSLQELFGYLQGGVPVVLAPPEARKDAVALLSLCRQHSVSRLVLVPSLLRALVDSFGADFANEFPYLRYYIVSGEAFSSDLLREFLKVAPSGSIVMNLYGSTESSGDITWAAYTAKSALVDTPIVPIGQAIPPNRVFLLDPDTLQPVATGERGEIFVQGPHVTSGYLNRPKENETRFLELPGIDGQGVKRTFRTGDFGKFDELMQIHYLGREDQQIKVHGQRVDVLHVEFALNEALLATSREEGITKQACAVMAIPSNQYPGSYRLLGFVETSKLIDEEKLRKHMLGFVLSAHIPDSFIALDALPKLVNGKLDRVALKQAAIKLAGVEPTVTEERDSFGVLRKILAEHADTRRVVGIMCTVGLFFVIFIHWMPLTHDVAWVVQFYRAFRLVSDNTLLMVGVGALHGMGGQDKFEFSAYEPCFLLCWLVIHFMYAVVGDTTEVIWFLPVILFSRVWVILWHKVLRILGREDTTTTNVISIFMAACPVMFELDPPALLRGKTFGVFPYGLEDVELFCRYHTISYVYLYLFGFYMASKVAEFASAKLRSTFGRIASSCVFIILIFAMKSLCISLTRNRYFADDWWGDDQDDWNVFGSPFYFEHWYVDRFAGESEFAYSVSYAKAPQWAMVGTAMILNVLHVCSAIAFFASLPEKINLTTPGPAMLIMFATNDLLRFCVRGGTMLFGVRLFPSMPDVLHSLAQVHVYIGDYYNVIGGSLQLMAMISIVLVYMASITHGYTFLAGMSSRGFNELQSCLR